MENTSKNARKLVKILGIDIDSTRLQQVLTSVEEKISHNKKFYITTPNPELVLASTKNSLLKKALNSADFSIPDGVGLKIADFKLNIIKGRILFEELIKASSKNGWKVFLLGGMDNEASVAALKLKDRYRNLKIDSLGGDQIKPNLERQYVAKINQFGPDLLFVAFGNPKQEVFMYENIKKLNVTGMMAVGGTFRYISGLSKLPPKWMEAIGLEWVFRLITEPYRIKRIFNALILFPLKVLQTRLSQ